MLEKLFVWIGAVCAYFVRCFHPGCLSSSVCLTEASAARVGSCSEFQREPRPVKGALEAERAGAVTPFKSTFCVG